MTIVRKAQRDKLLLTECVLHLPGQYVLADPAWWANAIMQMDTLGNKKWVDAEIMDRFLLQSWAAVKDAAPPVLYVSIRAVVRCTQSEPLSTEETANQRGALFMTEDTAKDPRPVVFVFFDARAKHYFFCAFDYEKLHAFTWGRIFNQAGNEKVKWREGPRIWRRLASLLGRGTIADPITWRGFNWLQVSHQ